MEEDREIQNILESLEQIIEGRVLVILYYILININLIEADQLLTTNLHMLTHNRYC
jgi:hypothetical protein